MDIIEQIYCWRHLYAPLLQKSFFVFKNDSPFRIYDSQFIQKVASIGVKRGFKAQKNEVHPEKTKFTYDLPQAENDFLVLTYHTAM